MMSTPYLNKNSVDESYQLSFIWFTGGLCTTHYHEAQSSSSPNMHVVNYNFTSLFNDPNLLSPIVPGGISTWPWFNGFDGCDGCVNRDSLSCLNGFKMEPEFPEPILLVSSTSSVSGWDLKMAI
jgi:hypothetical protein